MNRHKIEKWKQQHPDEATFVLRKYVTQRMLSIFKRKRPHVCHKIRNLLMCLQFPQTLTMAKWAGIFPREKKCIWQNEVNTSSGKNEEENAKFNEYSLPGRNNYLWVENIQHLISSDDSSSKLLLGWSFFKESINCCNSIPTNLGLTHLEFRNISASHRASLI